MAELTSMSIVIRTYEYKTRLPILNSILYNIKTLCIDVLQ